VTAVNIEPVGEDVPELRSDTAAARASLTTAAGTRHLTVSAGYGLKLAVAAGGAGAAVTAISCVSTNICVGVGYCENSSGGNVGLIETLSNGVWTRLGAPPQPGGSSLQLTSVSCGAPGSRVAVSGFGSVIETLPNGTRSATNAPFPANTNTTPPPGQGVNLNSAGCAGAGSCVIAGIYPTDKDNNEQGVLDELSNGTWITTEAPLPADGDPSVNARFDTVSCSSAQSCLVLGGTYGDSSGNIEGLIETN